MITVATNIAIVRSINAMPVIVTEPLLAGNRPFTINVCAKKYLNIPKVMNMNPIATNIQPITFPAVASHPFGDVESPPNLNN